MRDFGLKKLYYSISEVSKLTGLEQYILRYWESEFEQLKPAKNRAGNRIYTNKDIKLILEIKKLLRDEKYTIEGAKNILAEKALQNNSRKSKAVKQNHSVSETVKPPVVEEKSDKNTTTLQDDLLEIKNFLLDLHSKL